MGPSSSPYSPFAAQLDRDYIREKTLEGQQAAAACGNHGGRPKVIDEDDVLFARALRDNGVPMPDIVKKLTIKTGKNAGQHPSVASAGAAGGHVALRAGVAFGRGRSVGSELHAGSLAELRQNQ